MISHAIELRSIVTYLLTSPTLWPYLFKSVSRLLLLLAFERQYATVRLTKQANSKPGGAFAASLASDFMRDLNAAKYLIHLDTTWSDLIGTQRALLPRHIWKTWCQSFRLRYGRYGNENESAWVSGNAQHYASTIAGCTRLHHFSSARRSFLRPYRLCWFRFAFNNPVDSSLKSQQQEFHSWFKTQHVSMICIIRFCPLSRVRPAFNKTTWNMVIICSYY